MSRFLASTCTCGVIAALAVAVGTDGASGATPTVKCHGHVATIVGTQGHDRLVGTKGRDVIAGRGGTDEIAGRGGNDLICGGPEFDDIGGGKGDDRIYGGGFRDYISGDAGDDVIHGGARHDYLNGGSGDDKLYGDALRTTIWPGLGKDLVSGSDVDYLGSKAGVHVNLAKGIATGPHIGHDRLVGVKNVLGTDYNDRIIGNAEKNTLIGSLGNDHVDGRGGGDNLDGGGTSDWSAHRQNHATDKDTVIGGAGNDVITGGRDHGSSAGVAVHSDSLSGGRGDDTFMVEMDENTVDGGKGTDLIEPGNTTGDDTWTIDLQAGTATVSGVTSTLIGIEDADGGFQEDTIRGDGGPNVLLGGSGNDQLVGRGGDDRLNASYKGGAPQPDDSADGGDGTDACRATTTTNCESMF